MQKPRSYTYQVDIVQGWSSPVCWTLGLCGRVMVVVVLPFVRWLLSRTYSGDQGAELHVPVLFGKQPVGWGSLDRLSHLQFMRTAPWNIGVRPERCQRCQPFGGIPWEKGTGATVGSSTWSINFSTLVTSGAGHWGTSLTMPRGGGLQSGWSGRLSGSSATTTLGLSGIRSIFVMGRSP